MPITDFGRQHAADYKLIPSRFDYFDQWLDEHRASGLISSFSIQVRRKGDLVYETFLGEDVSGNPLTEHTIFPVASVTKTIIALLTLTLMEDGYWDLLDPIARFTPFEGEGKDKISIKQLLTHSSGLVDPYMHHQILAYLIENDGLEIELPSKDDPYLEGEDHDRAFAQAVIHAGGRLGIAQGSADDNTYAHKVYDDLICLVATPSFPPRDRTCYCSTGYNILKNLIVKITGKPIDQYARERLFDPLGMVDSHFLLPKEKLNRIPVYLPGQEGYPWGNEEGNYFTNDSGGGGLKSTMHDLTRFGEMLRQGGTLEGVQIISPVMTNAMFTDYNYNLNSPYYAWTLGFNIKGQKYDDTSSIRPAGVIDHSGAGGTKLFIDRENELSWLILCTRHNDFAQVYGRVSNIVYSALD